MNLKNKNLYRHNRRFKEVYPDIESFTNNTSKYYFTPIEQSYIISIFNRLSDQYANSFFRYENIGTIYTKTGEFINNISPLFLRLSKIEEAITRIDDGLSSSTTRYYETDNTRDENINGYLVNETKYTSSDFAEIEKLNDRLVNLRQKINNMFKDFQKYLTNDIIMERENYYGY